MNRRSTGIVRRLDSLGRVVLPKEIRRTMRIREGDPLEIYTDRDGEVIFKKYSPIGELASFASQYAETLHKTCSLSVVICDRDVVIASAGLSRKEYAEKPLSDELEQIINARSLYVWREGEPRLPVVSGQDGESQYLSCAMPILCEGDIIGCVASVRTGDLSHAMGDRTSNDVECKLIQTAAGFLGRQMEN